MKIATQHKQLCAQMQELRKEFQELQEAVRNLKQVKVSSANESIMKLWDNKYDERWNNC